MVESVLTLSPHKAETPASPTVTNSRKAETPACRFLIYSHKAEISAWKFWREKTLTNNVSGSSGPGDPMLWELRG